MPCSTSFHVLQGNAFRSVFSVQSSIAFWKGFTQPCLQHTTSVIPHWVIHADTDWYRWACTKQSLLTVGLLNTQCSPCVCVNVLMSDSPVHNHQALTLCARSDRATLNRADLFITYCTATLMLQSAKPLRSTQWLTYTLIMSGIFHIWLFNTSRLGILLNVDINVCAYLLYPVSVIDHGDHNWSLVLFPVCSTSASDYSQ